MTRSPFHQLDIQKPCNQNYNQMAPAPTGRHCNSCDYLVIDFTEYSAQEIIDYFQNKKPKTCGRLTTRQIDQVNRSIQIKKSSALKNYIKSGLVASTLLLSACKTTKQAPPTHSVTDTKSHYEVIREINPPSDSTYVIKGIMVDESGEPLILADFGLLHYLRGTETDFDGNFELTVSSKISDDAEVVSSYIGFSSLSMKLSEVKNKEIKVIMSEEKLSDDVIIIIGEVEVEYPLSKKVWYRIKSLLS